MALGGGVAFCEAGAAGDVIVDAARAIWEAVHGAE